MNYPVLLKKLQLKKTHQINIVAIKKNFLNMLIRLQEKQKLRFNYGLTESQLIKYVQAARKNKRCYRRNITSIIRNAIR